MSLVDLFFLHSVYCAAEGFTSRKEARRSNKNEKKKKKFVAKSTGRKSNVVFLHHRTGERVARVNIEKRPYVVDDGSSDEKKVERK